MSTLKHSPKYEFSCFPQILHLKHEQSKENDQCESAHFYFQIYTNKKYSHAPSKRRFLQFLSLKTIKGNLETGPCLFVRNEGSGQVRGPHLIQRQMVTNR